MSIQTIEVGRKVTGYHQVTNLSSAQPCPGVGTEVMLQAEGGDLRYRVDGVDPTASVGTVLHDGEDVRLELSDIRVIAITGTGTLNVVAYR